MGGCSGCGGSHKSSGSHSSKPMKNWGGMKMSSKTSSGSRKMTGGSSGGRYGRPSVNISFGGKKR